MHFSILLYGSQKIISLGLDMSGMMVAFVWSLLNSDIRLGVAFRFFNGIQTSRSLCKYPWLYFLKRNAMCTISIPIQKEALLEKSIFTIDKLHPPLEKKCACGILENIQHSSQVLLVSPLTTKVLYYSLHLKLEVSHKHLLNAMIRECAWKRSLICGFWLWVNYWTVCCLFRLFNDHLAFDSFPQFFLILFC